LIHDDLGALFLGVRNIGIGEDLHLSVAPNIPLVFARLYSPCFALFPSVLAHTMCFSQTPSMRELSFYSSSFGVLPFKHVRPFIR